MSDYEIYLAAIEPLGETVSIYDGPAVFLEQAARVSRPQLLLFAAYWLHEEVCNGGFCQFFSNSTGVLAPEAYEAYQAIGLMNCSTLIGKAIRQFGEDYPRDRATRERLLKELCKPAPGKRKKQNPFVVQEEVYYQSYAGENGGFDAAMSAYTLRHLNELPQEIKAEIQAIQAAPPKPDPVELLLAEIEKELTGRKRKKS